MDKRKHKREWILSILVYFSLFVGIACSFIPWGDPNRFHGQGIPFSSVMWDKASLYYEGITPENDHLIPFDNLWAFALNPIAVFVLCMCLWGITNLMTNIISRMKKARS